ncbi:hydrophobe/amphiphile efflux-1 (HAE1) family transporter [Vibrio phage SHOU24]|uniref:hydrophobe/amphiphile efflux-1 (HAE1) family transporter n=1 Tax=Vibrio phage SHOU24 TaxID=1414739 RepID=UPI0003ED2443|nr:hydrophobe/amphiphile efflux-1 (HAE1) family transporter [Vibrio phage SHOU24]AHI61263.1 hydrophobe/amphiphile efflux-1 (HAE1) family transporter [Vibrio phage SHOU24]
MAGEFLKIKSVIEQAIISKANQEHVRVCVEDTGDLVNDDFNVSNLVDAFDQEYPFISFSVEDDQKRKLVVGKGASRIYGSIILTLYAPKGQANTGGAKLSDFVYDNFHSTRVGDTLLRDVRKLSDYKLGGWNTKVLQVSFEHTVNP